MRSHVIHVVIHAICHGIVQRMLQDKEMSRFHKLKMNQEYWRIMLKFQRQEKPY
jgi:hypothetical protein